MLTMLLCCASTSSMYSLTHVVHCGAWAKSLVTAGITQEGIPLISTSVQSCSPY